MNKGRSVLMRVREVEHGSHFSHESKATRDYWTTGLDYWTTGLTQTAKYISFSAEQKLNILIHSVTLLPSVFLEFLEIKGHVNI